MWEVYKGWKEVEPLSSLPPSPFHGFRQFFKGGNIYLTALDAEDASYLGGSGDMFPREIFKKRTLRNAVSRVSGTQESVSQGRLKFTQIVFIK